LIFCHVSNSGARVSRDVDARRCWPISMLAARDICVEVIVQFGEPSRYRRTIHAFTLVAPLGCI
jgi:hypothetical protein